MNIDGLIISIVFMSVIGLLYIVLEFYRSYVESKCEFYKKIVGYSNLKLYEEYDYEITSKDREIYELNLQIKQLKKELRKYISKNSNGKGIWKDIK